MKKKYQNGFFIFGLLILIIMVSQLDFREVWHRMREAGYWFLAVVALWGALYVFNTLSWYIIINNGLRKKCNVGFWWLYKITISGFAL